MRLVRPHRPLPLSDPRRRRPTCPGWRPGPGAPGRREAARRGRRLSSLAAGAGLAEPPGPRPPGSVPAPLSRFSSHRGRAGTLPHPAAGRPGKHLSPSLRPWSILQGTRACSPTPDSGISCRFTPAPTVAPLLHAFGDPLISLAGLPPQRPPAAPGPHSPCSGSAGWCLTPGQAPSAIDSACARAHARKHTRKHTLRHSTAHI